MRKIQVLRNSRNGILGGMIVCQRFKFSSNLFLKFRRNNLYNAFDHQNTYFRHIFSKYSFLSVRYNKMINSFVFWNCMFFKIRSLDKLSGIILFQTRIFDKAHFSKILRTVSILPMPSEAEKLMQTIRLFCSGRK